MTIRLSLRPFLTAAPLWALAGILLCAAPGRAQDPSEQRHRRENRFLFVIDTSSAMKARTNGIEEAVTSLLASGMKGQLRKGDTIGVWTYSDRLNADFPMQIWSDKKKDDIVSEVRDHLRGLHYEKRSHLEKVLPEIDKLVAHSERVTILLIFDGTDSIKGTRFDKEINELHKQYVREFKTSHSPFVTVLAAHNGAVFDYTINYPSTVVIPPTADPLPPPETNTPPPVVVAPPPAPKPPPHRIEITLSGSNFAHTAIPPPPAPSNTVALMPITPVPASVPAIVSNPPPPVVAAPVVIQPVNTNVAPLQSASPPLTTTSTPPPAPAVVVPPRQVPVAPPQPMPVAAVPVVPAPPPASTVQQVSMFVIALSLLTIAVVLVLFLVRRSRGGSQPSLISQSIDRSR